MLLNEKCYVKHEYRKTANIRPRLGYTESQAFFGGLIQRAEGEGGGSYTKPVLCLEFFTTGTCISRKRNGIRQKNNALAAKCCFTS